MEYDEGFDENWTHIITGTKYDEYGFSFSKNGTIHKDTGLPKDKKGYSREHYGKSQKWEVYKSKFNEYNKLTYIDLRRMQNEDLEPILNKVIIRQLAKKEKEILNGNCFDKLIKGLFFQENDLNILKQINNIVEKEYSISLPSRVELKDHKHITDQIYTRPTCLDGSPDMRYNGGFTIRQTTVFNMSIGKTNINEVLQGKVSEQKIQEAIDEYNMFLFAMKDQQFEKVYRILENINNECKENIKYLTELVADEKDKIDICKKLKQHKDKFTKEQSNKFENLVKDIKTIGNKIEEIDDHSVEFEESYKKLKFRLNEIKAESGEAKENNEINDLFKQLK